MLQRCVEVYFNRLDKGRVDVAVDDAEPDRVARVTALGFDCFELGHDVVALMVAHGRGIVIRFCSYPH